MSTSEEIRVELAVRTLAPPGSGGRQREVIERLLSMEERGVVDAVDVNVWGQRVGLTGPDAGTDHGRAVVERVEAFRSWAGEHGVSVEEFFPIRTAHSAITDESVTALELPSMVLAEYRDGDLHWVSPCAEADTVHSVDDRLSTLDPESDRERSGPAPRTRVAPVAEE